MHRFLEYSSTRYERRLYSLVVQLLLKSQLQLSTIFILSVSFLSSELDDLLKLIDFGRCSLTFLRGWL